MEKQLQFLSETRPVGLTTVPPRYGARDTDPIHYEIALVNNYIREVVLRINRVNLIDFG